jgi:hypothetical protein
MNEHSHERDHAERVTNDEVATTPGTMLLSGDKATTAYPASVLETTTQRITERSAAERTVSSR